MEPIRDRERQGEAVTLRLVQDHAAELLRFARRFSHCADDAHDAYQRGIEILVRRMRTSPPDNPLNWLRTVSARVRSRCAPSASGSSVAKRSISTARRAAISRTRPSASPATSGSGRSRRRCNG